MEQNGKRIVYADNAATTAVSPAVLDAMLPFYKELYGNPSSLYSLGNAAKKRWRKRARRSPAASAPTRTRSISPRAAARATTGPSKASRTS